MSKEEREAEDKLWEKRKEERAVEESLAFNDDDLVNIMDSLPAATKNRIAKSTLDKYNAKRDILLKPPSDS